MHTRTITEISTVDGVERYEVGKNGVREITYDPYGDMYLIYYEDGYIDSEMGEHVEYSSSDYTPEYDLWDDVYDPEDDDYDSHYDLGSSIQ